MHILFVTPYPLSRIRVRAYGFVSQLSKQHNVRVLALCTGEREMADVRALQHEGISITAIQEKRGLPLLRSLYALGSRLPFQVAFAASPALRTILTAYLETGCFDVLHVESVRALGALPDTLPIPAVWDAVDCISQLYEQGAKARATLRLRFAGWTEAKRIRAYEHTQLHRFQHVLVTAERDRQALLNIARNRPAGRHAQITVLPHGVDQQYFQPYTGRRQRDTLVFSGKMNFHANVAGVLNLVTHILPLIWKRRPGMRLIIAGSDPPLMLRRLASDPRIEITGYVSDLRPYIAQAQVAVCPLPYAVGIQNKVLEAMALGTPVVASSNAVAGLQAITGRDLLVADEPEAFAAEVLRLLEDQILWNTLVERGLAYIATYHNWEYVIRKLTTVYAHAQNNLKGRSPVK